MNENIIQQSLQTILESYAQARTSQTFAGHSLRGVFQSLKGAVSSLPAISTNPNLRVKWSMGQGNWAKVPWIALLDEKETDTTQRGVYCVYLFRQDMSGVYLTFNQGVTHLIESKGKVGAYAALRARAQELRPRCAPLLERGFKMNEAIDLKAEPGLGADYEPSTIAHKFYEAGNLPDDQKLAADLDALVSVYQNHLIGAADQPPVKHEEVRKLSAFISSLTVAANTPISRALLSKPFLILTGPSGTGKTRGAIQLAESLCDADCRAVVAVGADWTDNRHVVGFLNPLQTVDGTPTGAPIYETTAILNLLLHANAHSDQPHVLILDEMNLSHVERYFADFLSAMELKDKAGALKLHSAGLAKTRKGVDVEGSIHFPENLFVIGTVNIDETTYMFSPKVLDRANVIEIHADPTALDNFLKGVGGEAAPEARNHGVSFLDAARVIRNEDAHEHVPPLPPTVRELAAQRLMELFEIMKRGRGEFGFRTGREVLAYLRTAHFLTPEAQRAAWAEPTGDWLKALDAQILQKILPKLHGSRTRLAPLLGALAQYCATGTKAAALEHFPEEGNSPKRGLKDARNLQNPKFKESYKKLERMIDVLVEEQFVSFIC
jgi:hypothetical protein